MFFNPGELEALLEAQTNPLVWLDQEQLGELTADFSHDPVDPPSKYSVWAVIAFILECFFT